MSDVVLVGVEVLEILGAVNIAIALELLMKVLRMMVYNHAFKLVPALNLSLFNNALSKDRTAPR